MTVKESALLLRAADGRRLGATAYEPAEGAPQTAVVFVGAFGVPQRFYAKLARHLAANGLAALTYDPRGIGASVDRPLRADPATLADWGQLDQPAALAAAAARWPEAVRAAVAHSFGGQALGLNPAAGDLQRVAVIAAAVGDLSLFPPIDRWRYTLWVRGVLRTAVWALGYAPRWLGVGEAMPAGVPRQWAEWCATPNYLRGAMPAAALHYEAVRAQMTFVNLSDDPMAPERPSAALRAWYPQADVRHREVRPAELGVSAIGHFGYFRPGPTAPLWAELLAFLRAGHAQQ